MIAFTVLTGSQLRAIRLLRNMTQAELAFAAGISQNAIAEFETGKRDLRSKNLQRICEALNVAVVYKIDGTEITGP